LPTGGKVFLSVKNSDKPRAVKVAKDLVELGFQLLQPVAQLLRLLLKVLLFVVNKVVEGRPHVVDMIKNNEIAMVITQLKSVVMRLLSRAIRTSA
jgi:carbamoyl-phosphate synthase large subunit